MSDQSLFRVDSLTINGVALAIVDSSVRVDGLVPFRKEVVPSASGPDFESKARVPRVVQGQIQFGPKVSPEELAKIEGARMVLTDLGGPRRILAPNVSLGSFGTVGSGPVDVTFNVLEPYVYL